MDEKTFEQLASEQHDIWSHWMNYLFSICETNDDGSVTIPAIDGPRITVMGGSC